MNRNLSAALLRPLLWFTLAAMPLWSQAVEVPDYEVIRKLDNVELRQYAPFVVAEVVLDATADEAGVATQGEPVLARYNAPFTPRFLRRNEIWLALR